MSILLHTLPIRSTPPSFFFFYILLHFPTFLILFFSSFVFNSQHLSSPLHFVNSFPSLCRTRKASTVTTLPSFSCSVILSVFFLSLLNKLNYFTASRTNATFTLLVLPLILVSVIYTAVYFKLINVVINVGFGAIVTTPLLYRIVCLESYCIMSSLIIPVFCTPRHAEDTIPL